MAKPIKLEARWGEWEKLKRCWNIEFLVGEFHLGSYAASFDQFPMYSWDIGNGTVTDDREREDLEQFKIDLEWAVMQMNPGGDPPFTFDWPGPPPPIPTEVKG